MIHDGRWGGRCGFENLKSEDEMRLPKLKSPPLPPPLPPSRLPGNNEMQYQLQACKSVEQLKAILARSVVTGFVRRALCKLVEFLALSQNPTFLLYARILVDVELPRFSKEEPISASSTTFLWNNLIKGYSRGQFPEQGLVTYARMLHQSSKPDNFTFPFVVKASASGDSVYRGRQVHSQIVRNGFESDVFVVNTLLNMYSFFRDLESAQTLFDISPNLDVVSWNTLIDGYVKSGTVEVARLLFDRMPERNEISWSSMISGYASTGELDVAQSLFDRMPIRKNAVTYNSMISGFARCGFLSLARRLFDEMPSKNIASWNSMISSYAQNGELELAQRLFNEMPERDVFSWSCMISGYAQNNRDRDALELFKKMQAEGRTRPNEVTLVSVLSACSHLVLLDEGKWIHAYIERNGMRLTENLGAALIDMYAKCGSVDTAVEVFWKLDHRNVSTWNALITGLAINGVVHGALDAFGKMQRMKTKPNDITFLGVLMACCHGGLVEEGCNHFESMSKVYGIHPKMKHYGCMIDLLGRAGMLDEAEEIVRSMPMKPDVMVLGALLGACRIHGNVQLADRLRKDFLDLKSSEAGCHVLLSNIYAAAGRWADSVEMRSVLNVEGIKKQAGSSSIESSEIGPTHRPVMSVFGWLKEEQVGT